MIEYRCGPAAYARADALEFGASLANALSSSPRTAMASHRMRCDIAALSATAAVASAFGAVFGSVAPSPAARGPVLDLRGAPRRASRLANSFAAAPRNPRSSGRVGWRSTRPHCAIRCAMLQAELSGVEATRAYSAKCVPSVPRMDSCTHPVACRSVCSAWPDYLPPCDRSGELFECLLAVAVLLLR